MIDNIELSCSPHAHALETSRPANVDGLNELSQQDSRDYSTLENRKREAVRARSLINGTTPDELRELHVKEILSGLRQPADDAESSDLIGRAATNLAGALKKGHVPNEQEQEVSQTLREQFDGTLPSNIAPEWQEHVVHRLAAALADGKTHLDPQEQTKTAKAVLERSTKSWINPDLRNGAVSATFMISAEHPVDTDIMRVVGQTAQEILSRKAMPNDAYANIAKHASTALRMNRFPKDVCKGLATSLVQSLPKVGQAGSPSYSHVALMIADSAAVSGTAPNIDANTIRTLSQNPNLDDKYRPLLACYADLHEYQTTPNIQNFIRNPGIIGKFVTLLTTDPGANNLILRMFPAEALTQISTLASKTATEHRGAGNERSAAPWEAFSRQCLAAAKSGNARSGLFHD